MRILASFSKSFSNCSSEKTDERFSGAIIISFAASKGFLVIAIVILLGQWLIVTLAGEMFSVVPLEAYDWVVIIASTSIVLWAGEIIRLFRKK